MERVDSGYRLDDERAILARDVTRIYAYGDETQRKTFLPKLASGEWVGLLRADRAGCGLRSGRHEGRARRRPPPAYRISGAKMWISNSPIADVFVVWAKSTSHNDEIRGFILQRGMKGLSAPKIGGKLLAARLDHGRDRDGTASRLARDALLPKRVGPEGGPFRPASNRAPLRHLLGGARRGGRIAGTALAQYTLDRKAVSAGRSRRRSSCRRSSPDMQTEITLGLQASLAGRPPVSTRAAWPPR